MEEGGRSSRVIQSRSQLVLAGFKDGERVLQAKERMISCPFAKYMNNSSK